jgi:hypothetical protein
MSKLTSPSAKSIVEMTGIVAVAFGLLFVAIELRQNTAAMQAETIQGLNDSSQEYLLVLASDPSLIELQQKAVAEPDSLNDIEERQYYLLERTRWLRSQNAFTQYQRGTLGDNDWETYSRLVCTREQSSWQDQKSAFALEFVQFVESTCDW